jgi:hypothetical protein
MDNLQAKTGFLPGLFRPRNEAGKPLAFSSEKAKKPEMADSKPATLLQRLPNGPRNHFVALVGEFCGTFLFLYLPLSPSASEGFKLTFDRQPPQIFCICRNPGRQHAPNGPGLGEYIAAPGPRPITTAVH